ncbi:MAG TPA: Maf family protein [Burkholderiaceae bacterium]|nr:Maf family protein [Burkholderiaceae bacterium]
MTDVYLASRSPRRRELLKQIGVKFEPLMLRLTQPRGADIDEARQLGEPPSAYVERIAREKAHAAARAVSLRSMFGKPVLTADTVVVLDDETLDKPGNPTRAAEFLRRLSGRTHEVRTCVVVTMGSGNALRLLTQTSVSHVTFCTLTETQIAQYCASNEPLDKAGGYAIQGLAAVFVQRLEGSYSGVMGLPLFETAQLLRQAGVPVL